MKIKLLKSEHKDGIKAEKLLEQNNIEFITVLSCADVIVPELIVPGRIYSYKGLSEIKGYIETHKKQL